MVFDGTWKIDRNENYDKFMEKMGKCFIFSGSLFCFPQAFLYPLCTPGLRQGPCCGTRAQAVCWGAVGKPPPPCSHQEEKRPRRSPRSSGDPGGQAEPPSGKAGRCFWLESKERRCVTVTPDSRRLDSRGWKGKDHVMKGGKASCRKPQCCIRRRSSLL